MTKVVEYLKLLQNENRVKMRQMEQDSFIKDYGSGTLRKSAGLYFNINEAYLNERVKFEFGYGFEITQRSRVVYTDIKLVPAKALTELGWHLERMNEIRPFEEDIFEAKFIEVQYADGKIKKGAGIFVRETSAAFVPNGHIVFSIVAEYKNKKYKNAINPF